MRLLYSLEDDQYPDNGYNHVRKVVRAFVFDKEMKHIALHYIHAKDIFGERDYYETPGGGVKKGETLQVALRRELKEELGVEVEIIKEVGKVIDYYNLINRKNINYYYIVKVVSVGEKSLEPREQSLIEKTVWVTTSAAINLYEHSQNILVGKLVKQRELPLLYKIRKFSK
jgi:8-oxo-dGTP pyrophosphatase MutT (NUDIX family)